MRNPASEKAEIIRRVEQSHLPAKRTLDSLAYAVPRFTAGMIDIAKHSTDANGPCPQGAACFRPA